MQRAFYFLLYYLAVLTVIWPSVKAREAEVWRVLDLSGLTNSVRQSRNFIKAGFVFLNNTPVSSIKSTVAVGETFRLELRFPNGVVQGANIFLTRPVNYPKRQSNPDTRFHKP